MSERERGGEAPRPTSPTPILREVTNPVAQCYELMRQNYPARVGLAVNALKYHPAAEILDDIRECIKTGGDIGEYLGGKSHG